MPRGVQSEPALQLLPWETRGSQVFAPPSTDAQRAGIWQSNARLHASPIDRVELNDCKQTERSTATFEELRDWHVLIASFKSDRHCAIAKVFVARFPGGIISFPNSTR